VLYRIIRNLSFENETLLNNIEEFGYYILKNTPRQSDKDQLVKAV
jgi:hypothetical protein